MIYSYIIISGGVSPLFMAGHRQVVSCVSKGKVQKKLTVIIIATLNCQGNSQGGVFLPGHLPWHALG